MQLSLKAAPLFGLATLAVLGLTRSASAQAHSYDLTQSYADAYGGPSLTPNGGTRDSNGYTFAADQGPTLSGALTSLSSYSIEFVFSLNGTSGYQKLIDFKDVSPDDDGLYNLNGDINFYPYVFSAGSAVFTPGTPADVLLTRDGTTKLVTAYVDGVQEIQFTDTDDEAVFSSNDIHFFQDDTHTGGSESGPGLLKSININSTAAPEPSPVAGLGLAGLLTAGLILKARRRRAAAA